MTACQVCGGRDAVEEFLAAKVWPLAAGWSPSRFERKRFVGLKYDVTSSDFWLRRPELDWAFGLTEPIGSVTSVLGYFGPLKLGTELAYQKN